MRLIDIDKHFELNESFYKANIEMPLHRVKVALESLPTVEAIPIKWMRDYVSHWISEPYKNFVLNMIKIWEKENGK